MSIRKAIACVFAAGALSLISTLVQADTWRWQDAEGQVHFGDRPPPGVTAERIDVQTTPSTLTDEERQRRPEALRAAEAAKAAEAARKAQRAAGDAAAAADARAMDRGRCDRARWALAALESGRPVYRDANGAYRVKRPPNQPDTYTGPRQYLEDPERQRETARYQREMDQYCAAFPELQDKALAAEDLRHAEACEFAAAELQALQKEEAHSTPEEIARRQRFLDEECR